MLRAIQNLTGWTDGTTDDRENYSKTIDRTIDNKQQLNDLYVHRENDRENEQ